MQKKLLEEFQKGKKVNQFYKEKSPYSKENIVEIKNEETEITFFTVGFFNEITRKMEFQEISKENLEKGRY